LTPCWLPEVGCCVCPLCNCFTVICCMRFHYKCISCRKTTNPFTLQGSTINIRYRSRVHTFLLVHHEVGRPHSVVFVHNEFVVVEASSDFSKYLIQSLVVNFRVTRMMGFNLRNRSRRVGRSSKGCRGGSCNPCPLRLCSAEWPSRVMKSQLKNNRLLYISGFVVSKGHKRRVVA